MAAVSAQSSPCGSPAMPSPPIKGLKKVLSGRRRSSEAQSDGSTTNLRPDSLDSVSLLDKSPTRQSPNSSPSRDSTRSGSSGVRKLIPGHSKRKRRRVREDELKEAADDIARGRELTVSSPPQPLSRKTSSLLHDGDSSLLTDDSEFDSPPPLVSRDSHTGYLTTSSPLIKTTSVPDHTNGIPSSETTPAVESFPILVEPPAPEPAAPEPGQLSTVAPLLSSSTPALPTPGLIDKADTLRPSSRRSSISKLRGKSPARKIRDVFSSRSNKSPRSSPERRPGDTHSGMSSPLSRASPFGSAFTANEVHEQRQGRSPTHVPAHAALAKAPSPLPSLETDNRPLTPPAAVINTPVTTVTPPTPTLPQHPVDASTGSPKPEDESAAFNESEPRIAASPSGSPISHRRVRSTGSVSHQPSKLSNSVVPPLTPTIEEVRTPSGNAGNPPANRTVSGSFFSSWVSAAQNAATSITNLTTQNRSRAGTTASDPDPSLQKHIADAIQEESETAEPDSPRKQLAVETLGSGELNLTHLGFGAKENGGSAARLGLAGLRNDSVAQRDVAAAKEEDLLAKRAVSAAYEKPDGATPVAELHDPMNQLRHAQTFNGPISGSRTPPDGSIFEGETGSIRRTTSVRSKIASRRSRGSSAATGQSTLAAMVGASTSALANPATGPRLTGFAMAPKQRNRNFHQQFRSVPDDDYLVEDYSCALQREILLAGRIYISEGHICFSSNILGWVTTLVISFEEVVSIEKESTAIVIPNAIAIQTLHARHTFRSLLSREATYDLLIGIWKVSHPASFQKSPIGKQMAAEEATKHATGTSTAQAESAPGSEGSSGDEDEDEDDEHDSGDEGSAPSMIGSAASVTGSDHPEIKALSRKPSAMNGAAMVQAAATAPASATNEPPAAAPAAPVAGPSDTPVDFPGPASHGPTECNDASTHYEIIIKDEVLAAPLGKIYSLMYGPQSGVFMRKFLVDECKSLDLVFEDDKKGLSNEAKTRQHTYIKPLGGSIGPKQTKCITTETLDFFDLEKAVTVTCSTQTPDVPSGNAFLTKTRYCLTWAPGNATRLQMNCTVEWSAKSWLKGPIEKGAKDGQQQYGESLVKTLKGAVGGRPRGQTVASKVSKSKKKRKGERKESSEKVEAETRKEQNWGLFEPLRGPLGPVVNIARPILKTEIMLSLLFAMVLLLWFRTPSTSLGPRGGWRQADRMVAYEEMWSQEESELWNWLEERAGVDTVVLRAAGKNDQQKQTALKQQAKKRQKALKSKEVENRLREEKMTEREMEEAIRITKERLLVLEGVVQKKKSKRQA